MSGAKRVAYSYIRFSTSEQAKGDSLRRQLDMAKEWCDRNGVRLDESLTLRDLGKSAYTGEHRKNPDRNALAGFLKMVKDGRIPSNAYLIVESLDRLTREDIKPALSLLLSLSDHVEIVQLQPVVQIYGKAVDPMQLMMAIVELSRGHSESKMKSVRVGKNWDNKRKQARAEGTPLPGRIPSWVEKHNGAYRLVADSARAVRLMFQLAQNGYGTQRIVKELIAREVAPIWISGRWNSSYVRQILENPSTYGVHQCRTKDGKPDGEPITDYFPAVVSETVFFAVQAVRTKGPMAKGRRSERVYLFNRLMRDALTGDHFNVHRHSANDKLVFVPASYKRGEPVSITSFPLEPFERALLQHLREIDVSEVLTGRNDEAENVLALTGRLAAVDAKIAELEAELEHGDVATLAKVLRKLEAQKHSVSEELDKARQKMSSPQAEAWGSCQNLIDALKKSRNKTEAMLKLRAAVHRIIDRINCIFVGYGKWRLAFVQVHFADSHAFREIHIIYHGRVNTFKGVKDECLQTDTWKVQPIPENEMSTYSDDIVSYLKQQADAHDKATLKRWPKRK